jgi:hypothetical protein
VHKLLRAPFVCLFYGLKKVKLRIQIGSALSLFLEFRGILHFLIIVSLIVIIGFDRESRAGNQHVLMFRPRVLEVESAFADHVQVLSGMKHLFLVFGKKYGHHLLSVGKPLLPIMIVKVSLKVFLAFRLVFSDYKLIERIFKDSLKDPFA